NGIRWVKPSSATVSPSCTCSATASRRDSCVDLGMSIGRTLSVGFAGRTFVRITNTKEHREPGGLSHRRRADAVRPAPRGARGDAPRRPRGDRARGRPRPGRRPPRRGRRGHLRRRQPGGRGQPQRRAHGRPPLGPERRGPRLHREPAVRLEPPGGRVRGAADPHRRRRRRRCGLESVRTGGVCSLVAGGAESRRRAPVVMAKPPRGWGAPPEMADTTLGWRLVNPRFGYVYGGKATISLGDTAEEVALLDGISREESDAWGLRSQQRTAAAAAHRWGDFVEVRRKHGALTEDEVPRPATTMEALAKLNPAFRRGGIVTAG